MNLCTSFVFTNNSEKTMKLILEPWAEEYNIPVGMKVEIVTDDPKENVIEVEYDGENVIVYGWADSMSVQSEGEVLEADFG